MNAPAELEYDLSELKSWRGLRPGMSRKEVEALLNAEGVDTSEWEEDEECFLVTNGWDLELVIDKHQRLYQISLEDGDKYRWAGRAIVDVPLHEALLAMQPIVSGAGWRKEDAVTDPFQESDVVSPSQAANPMGDAALLYEGTLWLPGAGLALMMCGGSVCEITWRQPKDVPTPFLSEVTMAQLELSQHPDLDDHLRSIMTREHREAAAANGNPVMALFIWLALAALVAATVIFVLK